MLLADFESLIAEACPKGSHCVFGVYAAGNSPNFSVRYSGQTGKGVTQKFLGSTTGPELRELLLIGDNFKETKILFQFLTLCPTGKVRAFRREYYERFSKFSFPSSFSSSPLTKFDFLREQQDRRIQFQLTVDLENLDIVEIRPSAFVKTTLDSSSRLRQAMLEATGLNNKGVLLELLG
jgi:hypothetical protein